ncbi:hypothetical protein DCAR_0207018 [Daucus carota subsp. sativus]|uniref:Uncharacterized protein n=1 Tax=Daucus carota subsp. sativus TaxID=79200 RepID=A0AAF0WD71_DAUCS|nr:hypothetical protein DCAR_0207018 [Daucus carota subsp. sativus]
MAMVTVLKRKIRKQDDRVDDKSNCVIQPFVVTEAIVSAFMTYGPKSSHNASLKCRVNNTRRNKI